MPRSKRLTRPSSGSPARSSRLRARAVTFTARPPSGCGATGCPLAGGGGEAGGDVLDVGVVLGVEAVADERDREGDGADQEAGDGDAEGDPEVFGEGGDVAVGEAGEGRGERDQGPHQAQRRAHADEDAGALEAAQGAVVVLGQALGDPGFGAGPADLVDDVASASSIAAVAGEGQQGGERLGRLPGGEPAAALGDRLLERPEAAPPPPRELDQQRAASTRTSASAARARTSTGTRSASETSKRICSITRPPRSAAGGQPTRLDQGAGAEQAERREQRPRRRRGGRAPPPALSGLPRRAAAARLGLLGRGGAAAAPSSSPLTRSPGGGALRLLRRLRFRLRRRRRPSPPPADTRARPARSRRAPAGRRAVAGRRRRRASSRSPPPLAAPWSGAPASSSLAASLAVRPRDRGADLDGDHRRGARSVAGRWSPRRRRRSSPAWRSCGVASAPLAELPSSKYQE